MKLLLLALLLLPLAGAPILAETIIADQAPSGTGGPGGADPSPAPGVDEKKPAAATSGTAAPTIIDSENMDYDEKTRVAIFTGDNYGVYVKDPSFTVYCDKLTAHMRKASAAAPAPPGIHAPTPTPAPKEKGKGKGAGDDPSASRGSGLQRAVAEGVPDRPVVIVQDKPGVNGAAPEHDVGIAQKADYNADTGDIYLYGWPRVSQGINTQVATSEKTIMIMNKNNNSLKTLGPSHSTIVEQEQPKKSDGKSASPDQTPSPSLQ